MTLSEAAENIGKRITYRVSHCSPNFEYGVITEVRSNWVFVRYGNDERAKATAARHLDLVAS